MEAGRLKSLGLKEDLKLIVGTGVTFAYRTLGWLW